MKKALITGANKSIGFETARQLLKRGYYIFLGSRDIAKGEQAVAQLRSEGLTQVEAIAIDVADGNSIKKARQGIKTASLDLLINNAGISGGFPQLPTQVPSDTIRKVFDTNFFGAIDVIKSFIDLLSKSPAPVIVNVTSGLGSLTLHSDPSWKYYQIKGGAYGPSKTALNAYTVALAYELRDTPFRVNAIDPGYTATDFNQHRGTGSVESAAAFVVKYATIPSDGPTGRYFSPDFESNDNESPW
jgi:NAD(P)-dependent dehydrogenase (short-subunit alcohol dehydrogenase family)